MIGNSKHTETAKLSTPARVESPKPTAALNLDRWKASGLAEKWVKARLSGWNNDDWLRLLAELRATYYWPMEEAAIGRHLEKLRAEMMGPRASQPQRAPNQNAALDPSADGRGLDSATAAEAPQLVRYRGLIFAPGGEYSLVWDDKKIVCGIWYRHPDDIKNATRNRMVAARASGTGFTVLASDYSTTLVDNI